MTQLTHRQFAHLCTASAAAALVPPGGDAAAATKRYRLRPQPALVPLLGSGAPETRVWGYHGRVPGPEIRLRRGQRLRLINTANARIFALRFEDHRPVVVALDGQPVRPHEAEDRRAVLPPAAGVDLILDMAGKPGQVSSGARVRADRLGTGAT